MKPKLKNSPYFHIGMTAFSVLSGCILFYVLLQHLNVVLYGLGVITKILNPFLWGFVISYLLLPMTRTFEYDLLAPIFRKATKREVPKGGAPRVIAIAMALVVACVMIFILFRLLLPTVYESIQSIFVNYSTYLNNTVDFINGLCEDYPELGKEVESWTRSMSAELESWIRERLLPGIGGLLSDVTGMLVNLTSGVYKVLQFVLNIFIGVVISCYVLYNRDRFAATWKRILYAVFGIHRSEFIQRIIRFADDAFMGFLIGKIIDSTIIGILTYICCEILDMPYPAFIAIIVGVTNIIPIFGPFIGAIPCAIIILMVSPVKCLPFMVMIFLIQQIDGNIIGPKILGNSVGINGFWIMFAIIVMGDLFGVGGMIIGVPLVVVLSAGVDALINLGLKKRGLCTEAALYLDMDHMDETTGFPVPKVGETDGNNANKLTESGE